MGKADYLNVGCYNMICDKCGKKFKNTSIRVQWDGLQVCKGCWEIRQPQDFVRGVQDSQQVPIARPDNNTNISYTAEATALTPISGGSL